MASHHHLFILLLVSSFLAAFVFVSATDHIVGANRGWNPNINYTSWSNNQTFYVGDLISFRYKKGMYNVFEVNETGYDNCTMDGVVGNWTSGKDFIPLDHAGKYYFIDGNGGCFSGMKVSIVVHPLNATAPSPSASSKNSTSSAAAGGGGRPPVSVVAAAVLAAIWIGVGSGFV